MKITTVQINEDEGVQKTKKPRSWIFQTLIGGKLDQPTSDAVNFNYQTENVLRLLLPRHPTEAN